MTRPPATIAELVAQTRKSIDNIRQHREAMAQVAATVKANNARRARERGVQGR